jgi:hypothetical protein
LQYSTSKIITVTILGYYFDNYDDALAKEYLYENIKKERISEDGWEVWSMNRDVFFKGDVVRNIASFIIKSQNIGLSDAPAKLGMIKTYRIRDDSLKMLCSDETMFISYLETLSLKSIMELLKNEGLQRVHSKVWDYAIPLYFEEAKEEKLRNDTDHPLFEMARRQLKPTKTPQWLRLSNKAQELYQEWALGARLEAFFQDDTDNQRILFWKRHLRYIDDIKEIEYRGDIEVFAITIKSYVFVEFKEVGAIYVYEKGVIPIPNKITNLESMKYRDKVVNAYHGSDRGEGWIAHQGQIWMNRANTLINKALKS